MHCWRHTIANNQSTQLFHCIMNCYSKLPDCIITQNFRFRDYTGNITQQVSNKRPKLVYAVSLKYTQHFSSHFPGKPGLANCPNNFFLHMCIVHQWSLSVIQKKKPKWYITNFRDRHSTSLEKIKSERRKSGRRQYHIKYYQGKTTEMVLACIVNRWWTAVWQNALGGKHYKAKARKSNKELYWHHKTRFKENCHVLGGSIRVLYRQRRLWPNVSSIHLNQGPRPCASSQYRPKLFIHFLTPSSQKLLSSLVPSTSIVTQCLTQQHHLYIICIQ